MGVSTKIRAFWSFSGGGQGLRRLHRHVELHDEDLVHGLPEHAVEEAETGGALGFDDADLAHAGIHHQADGERQFRIAREILDGLGAAVLRDLKIVFGQIFDKLTLAIEDSRKNVDDLDTVEKVGSASCARAEGAASAASRKSRRRIISFVQADMLETVNP